MAVSHYDPQTLFVVHINQQRSQLQYDIVMNFRVMEPSGAQVTTLEDAKHYVRTQKEYLRTQERLLPDLKTQLELAKHEYNNTYTAIIRRNPQLAHSSGLDPVLSSEMSNKQQQLNTISTQIGQVQAYIDATTPKLDSLGKLVKLDGYYEVWQQRASRSDRPPILISSVYMKRVCDIALPEHTPPFFRLPASASDSTCLIQKTCLKCRAPARDSPAWIMLPCGSGYMHEMCSDCFVGRKRESNNECRFCNVKWNFDLNRFSFLLSSSESKEDVYRKVKVAAKAK